MVVTDSQIQLHNVPVHIKEIKLDALTQIEEMLSANLPVDPQEASQIAKKRIENNLSISLSLQKIAQDLVEARKLGIKKIPAVVLNGRELEPKLKTVP